MSETAAFNAKTLSIVIPCYNEHDTWKLLLRRVLDVQLSLAKQVIIVDDGSKDGTRDQLRELAANTGAFLGGNSRDSIKVVFHEVNQGKGAALRTGFASADGEIVIVQDADLEYDPGDYPRLLAPILAGDADVVYGSRFKNGRPPNTYLKNYAANRFLTGMTNVLSCTKITDMETCYKLVKTSVLRGLKIEQNRFGFEPEITIKLAKSGVRLVELPISYEGRTHEKGKKIGWKDGLKAIWCIVKYARFDDSPVA